MVCSSHEKMEMEKLGRTQTRNVVGNDGDYDRRHCRNRVVAC